MFTGLWKQSGDTANPDTLVQYIERTHGGPLSFRGQLKLQATGNETESHVAGEPYHQISIFETDASEYAVVIRFFNSETAGLVDAEIVRSIDELDDFFCIHASDLFQNVDVATGLTSSRSLDVEQRIVSHYDAMTLAILNQLRAERNEAAPQVSDLRVKSAASGVDCSAMMTSGLDGSGDSGNE